MAEASNGADDLVGRVLDGRYAIEGRLGEGGLGVVYRATQTRLGRPVAVKVLHAEHAKRQQLRERFEREARSLARLAHPNIVDVIDYGIDGDAPFLVMELLEGRPLDAAIRSGLGPAEALAIGRGVIAAVAYAHDRGVVHRDLKPGNIFLQKLPDGSESPRVLDFGLAKFVGESSDGEALTKHGAILGTPAYMSPEQAAGAASDVRSDVYSLGIVLYELLTGTRPFGGSPAELLRKHLLEELPPLASARPGLPHVVELDAVLRRATAKQASQRYVDAAELLDALAPLAPERSSRAGGPEPRQAPRADADPSSEATVLRDAAPGAQEPTFVVGPRTSTTPERRRGPARLVFAVALGAGVMAGAAALAFGGDAEDHSDEASLAPTPALVAQAAPPEPAARPAPIDETRPAETPAARVAAASAAVARAREPESAEAAPRYALPPELAAIARRYRPGARLGDRDRGALFQWANAHRGDPRAWLLMAHLDFEYGARSDALRFYGYALREDARASADPTMLRDVVIMAGHRKVGGRAAEMLEDLWGRDAVPAIDGVMREGELDRDALRRLERVRARLLAMEGT